MYNWRTAWELCPSSRRMKNFLKASCLSYVNHTWYNRSCHLRTYRLVNLRSPRLVNLIWLIWGWGLICAICEAFMVRKSFTTTEIRIAILQTMIVLRLSDTVLMYSDFVFTFAWCVYTISLTLNWDKAWQIRRLSFTVTESKMPYATEINLRLAFGPPPTMSSHWSLRPIPTECLRWGKSQIHLRICIFASTLTVNSPLGMLSTHKGIDAVAHAIAKWNEPKDMCFGVSTCNVGTNECQELKLNCAAFNVTYCISFGLNLVTLMVPNKFGWVLFRDAM